MMVVLLDICCSDVWILVLVCMLSVENVLLNIQMVGCWMIVWVIVSCWCCLLEKLILFWVICVCSLFVCIKLLVVVICSVFYIFCLVIIWFGFLLQCRLFVMVLEKRQLCWGISLIVDQSCLVWYLWMLILLIKIVLVVMLQSWQINDISVDLFELVLLMIVVVVLGCVVNEMFCSIGQLVLGQVKVVLVKCIMFVILFVGNLGLLGLLSVVGVESILVMCLVQIDVCGSMVSVMVVINIVIRIWVKQDRKVIRELICIWLLLMCSLLNQISVMLDVLMVSVVIGSISVCQLLVFSVVFDSVVLVCVNLLCLQFLWVKVWIICILDS